VRAEEIRRAADDFGQFDRLEPLLEATNPVA